MGLFWSDQDAILWKKDHLSWFGTILVCRDAIYTTTTVGLLSAQYLPSIDTFCHFILDFILGRHSSSTGQSCIGSHPNVDPRDQHKGHSRFTAQSVICQHDGHLGHDVHLWVLAVGHWPTHWPTSRLVVFIFAAVVEYATANYFYHKPSRKRDRRPPAQSVANLNNNNNNGSEDSESIGSITGSQPNRLVKHVGRYARKVCDKLTPPFGEEDFVARRTGLDIDRRSRYLFPIFFVLFNVIYWITLGVYRSDD